jgi:hypothetical protein
MLGEQALPWVTDAAKVQYARIRRDGTGELWSCPGVDAWVVPSSWIGSEELVYPSLGALQGVPMKRREHRNRTA